MYRFFSLAPFLLLTFPLGCSNVPSDVPKLSPVFVTVTQDGNALKGADVALHAENDTTRWIVGGVSNARGIAEIYTHGKYKGAPIGQYKVTVSKLEVDSPPPPSADSPDYEKQYQRYLRELDRNPPPMYDLVDLNFGKSDKTPLTLDIKRGKNTHSLDVGKPVRILRPDGG